MQRQPNITRIANIKWKPMSKGCTLIDCIPILNKEAEEEWRMRIVNAIRNVSDDFTICKLVNHSFNRYAKLNGTWIAWQEED